MNPLIEKYGDESRWVNWKLAKTDDGKTTKIPLGSSTDPSTWTTYPLLKQTKLYGKGIVFTPDKLLLGVDIDHIINPTNNKVEHEQKEQIKEFIKQCNTYTETSPSGTGLHLFLGLISPLTLEQHKKAPYEIYNNARYFTFTGNQVKVQGAYPNVREVSPEEALKLLAIIGYPWTKAPIGNSVSHQAPKELWSDEELLTKAFFSKNGLAFRELHDGDIRPYNNDDSSADMAYVNHLAFWTGGNAEQIERIWLASPLGFRHKTQNRQDYRARTIETALRAVTEVYTPPEKRKTTVTDIIQNLDLLHTLKGKERTPVYTVCTENVCRILQHHPDFKDRLRYDEFKNRYEYKPKGQPSRQLEDNDVVSLQTEISQAFEFMQKVGKDMVYDAVTKTSHDCGYDSAKEYLTSVKWDSKPRLDTWLSTVYGTPNDLYHQKVGSNWLKGLVKRVLYPGCKFDYVLVLEGPQGIKKSTSLFVLGKDWYVETTMSTDTKDFFMMFQGKALIEFSEGETLSRTEVKRMKAIISTQIDTYRPPYQRVTQDFPRRCVFAMTTNQEQYLKDETGNRRWLPVTVVLSEINIEWLEENRDQIFAEAYYRVVTLKETIYEFPRQEMLDEQSKRRVQDPNEETIVDWYYGLTKKEQQEGITVDQVAKSALHMGFAGPISRIEQMSVGNVLREVLKLDKRLIMVNMVRRNRYFPQDPLEKMTIEVVETNAKTF